MFAREGYPFILGGAVLTAIAFALALRQRSWPLWLAALVVAIITLCVAWFFRNPTRTAERAPSVASAPAHGRMTLRTNVDAPTRVGNSIDRRRINARLRVVLGQRTAAGQPVIANLQVL